MPQEESRSDRRPLSTSPRPQTPRSQATHSSRQGNSIPSDRPRVSIGGTDCSACLAALVIETISGAVASCRLFLTTTDPGGPGLPGPGDPVDFGRKVTVAMQPASAPSSRPSELPSPIFEGTVYGVGLGRQADAAPSVEVSAFDALRPLAMVRRSRVLEHQTVADVMRLTASDHGLMAEVVLEAPVRETIVQADRTDLAFLQELSAESDADFWVEGGIFRSVARSAPPLRRVSLDFASDLQECRFFADLSGQREATEVGGWDVQGKSRIRARSRGDSTVSSREVSGPAFLERVWPSAPRASEPLPFPGEGTESGASSLAEALAYQRARGFAGLRAAIRGDPRIRPGTAVGVRGAGARFDGIYRVRMARHTFDSFGGYRTEFEANHGGVGR